jgi:hypothetical protein
MTRSGLLFSILIVLLTFLGCYACVLDDREGRLCLAIAEPFLTSLSHIGDYFVPKATETIPKIIPAVCFLLLCLGVRLRPYDNNLFFAALITAVASEYFLIIPKQLGCGALGYCVSLLLLCMAMRKANPLESVLREVQTTDPFTRREAILLLVITLASLVYRMHALNVNLDYFEGELSPYSASATSIPGMFIANRGYGAWAPLGILYYIPIYVMTKLFGVTLVALRLSSAIVGIFTIPVLYLFARRLAGREAALISALFLALNTQHVGWGRTDIHPHGVTTWPALLLGIVFLRACETQRVRDFILVTLAMGLTWHQYPSGQSAVAIPVLASGIYWLLNGFRLPFRWHHSLWIVLGVALWFIGLPLSYWYPAGTFQIGNPFNLTGPRALWGGLEDQQGTLNRALVIAEIALEHLGNVVEAIFFKARFIFHQDFLAEVYGMEPRTLPWLMTPFMFVALVLLARTAYRLEVAVLLSWLVVAILPGILSEKAYPKRLSTLFPALDIISAIGIVIALTYIRRGNFAWRRVVAGAALSVGFFSYAAFESRVWFSTIRPRYGEPPEINAVKEVAEFVTPGSLVISELSLGYYTGKITYLMLDHLTAPKNRPNAWLVSPRASIRSFIAEPLLARNFQDSWAYKCTKLRDQIDETAAQPAWDRVVFVLQEKPPNEDPDSRGDVELALKRCNNPRIKRIPSEGSLWVPLIVISCETSDLKS